MGILSTIGSVISPGWGTVLGGVADAWLGGESDRSSRTSAEAQSAKNEALQREFAQKGIQWRVADARAAGLSPLFALGGTGATYSPNAITVGDYGRSAYAEAGQDVSKALSGMQSPSQRALEVAQLREVAARTDAASAEATLARTRARQIEHDMLTRPGLGVGVGIEGPNGAVSFPVGEHSPDSAIPLSASGVVELKPSPQVSSSRYDSSSVAGTHPLWQRYRLSDGRYIYAPSQEASQSVQDMPLFMQALMLIKNLQEGAKPGKGKAFKRRQQEYFDLYRRQ